MSVIKEKVEKYNIHISTFISPALFWFIYDKDIPARKKYGAQIKALPVMGELHTPTIGQTLIVQYDGCKLRAELVKIEEVDTSKDYICWLIDYGIFCKVDAVFDMPDSLNILPCYLKKGNIFGLTSTVNELNIGTGKIEKISCDDWAEGIRHKIDKLITETKLPQTFVWKFEHNGFEVGHLLCQNPSGDEINVAKRIVLWGFGDYDEHKYRIDCFNKPKKQPIPLDVLYTTITTVKVRHKNNSTSTSKGRGILRHSTGITSIESAAMDKKPSQNESGYQGRGFRPRSEQSGPSKQSVRIIPKGPRAEPDFSDEETKDDEKCFSNNSTTSDDVSDKVLLSQGLSKIMSRLEKLKKLEDFEDAETPSSKGRGYCKISVKKEVDDDFETFSSKGRGFAKTSPSDSNNDDFETFNSKGRGFSKTSPNTDDFEPSSSISKLSLKDTSVYADADEFESPISRGRGFSKSSPKNKCVFDADDFESSSSKGRGFSKTSPKNSSVYENDDFESSSSKGRGFSKTSPKNSSVYENDDFKSSSSKGRGLSKSSPENSSVFEDDDFEPSSFKGRGLSKTSPKNSNVFEDDDFEFSNSKGRGLSKTSSKNSSVFEDYDFESSTSIGRGFSKSCPKNTRVFEDDDFQSSSSVGRGFSKNGKILEIDNFESFSETDSNVVTKKTSICDSDEFEDAIDDLEMNDAKSSKKVEPKSIVSVGNTSPADGNATQSKKRDTNRNDTYNSNSDDGKSDSFKNVGKASNCTRGSIPRLEGQCDCPNCEWNTSYEKVFQPYDMSKTQRKPKDVKKRIHHQLFKDKSAAVFKFEKHTDYTTNMDKLIAPRLLVHGRNYPQPVVDLGKLPFHSDVQRQLKHLNYNKAIRVQIYAWPAILRNQNLIVVNVPKSGKTMVYVPAICSFVLKCPTELTNAMGPLAVVICPGIESAENVYKIVIKIIDMHKKVALIIPPFGEHQQTELEKGVDILICTPRTFGRTIKERLIRLRRLHHVVLESAHELFELFPDEMEMIFTLCERRQSKINSQLQMIAVSQEWSPSLERFAKQLKKTPLICIGSYLEAALYGRTDIQVKFAESSTKPTQVIDMIKTKCTLYKTIIICNKLTEIDNLTDILNNQGISYVMLNQNSSTDNIVSVSAVWANSVCGNYPVLVCTDEILNTSLPISDASIIIQNSLPISWSQFAFRFASFTDNYPSPFHQADEKAKHCKMYIFVDETNLDQFPRMVQLLQRMGCQLNENILVKYEELLNNIELEKVVNQVEICDKIKLFGLCPIQILCKSRHILSANVDQSSNLPKSGLVKLKVLHICSVTSFYARLIEHTDSDGVVHQIEDKYAEIAAQMTKLANAKERKTGMDCNVGNVFGIEESDDLFRRCVVLRVQKHGVLNQPLVVAVRFLDTGKELVVPTSNLYTISEKLKKIPPQAVEIYLCNLGPPDRDSTWSQLCISRLDQEFNKAGYDEIDCYFTGRIKLQLRNAIWVENLILKSFLENGSVIINKMGVRRVLLKQKLADERPEHMQHLYALCKRHNFELPDYSLPKIQEQIERRKQAKPSWAHLDNSEEYNCVYMSTAQSPDNFYLRLAKNQVLLDRFTNEIKATMAKPLYPCVFDVYEGHCYLGKDPEDDCYGRVLVTKLENDIAHCFFVDYGDTNVLPITSLKYLSDDLIKKLPFQVIECKLWGVAPIESSWFSEATDIFYDLAFEPDTNIFRSLYVKVVADAQPNCTGYKKYSVILMNTYDDNVIMNELLVQKCFAVRTEEMIKVDFDKLVPKVDMEDCKYDEEEDDEIEEIQRESDEFDEDNLMDVQIYDAKAFFTELLKKKIQASIATSTPTIIAQPSPIARNALTDRNYSTPDVLWEQTNSHIILHIQLPGVKEYKLNLLRCRILTFRTEMQLCMYRLDLNLFAKVAANINHRALGFYVLVKLKKETEIEWERLVSNTERLRNISYNFSRLDVEDDDSDVEPDLTKPKPAPENDDENAEFVYEYGSDIDYNESDVESDFSSDD